MSNLTSWESSPNGDRVPLTARGQSFVATRKPGVRYRNATFLPDGKSFLALSDATVETEWWRSWRSR